MLLGSGSWDSTKTRQDRSAKSGLKISEHRFLWHRDPSERHHTGSGKKSGVARPRFTAPGGGDRRKLQNLWGKTLQRKPRAIGHNSAHQPPRSPASAKTKAVTAPEAGNIHTSFTWYVSVIHQHFCLQLWETKHSSNYWVVNYLALGSFQLTWNPLSMCEGCKMEPNELKGRYGCKLNWSMRTLRPLTFIITCCHSLGKEMRQKTDLWLNLIVWTSLFGCSEPSVDG